jgi:flavorubredoxin
MKNLTWIFEQGEHKWGMVARDPARPGYLIDTNEYLVCDAGEALLTDPGGSEIFAAVFATIARSLDLAQLKSLFASHQDPDIISSLAMWLVFNPGLKCHLSWLWGEFVPHFGGNRETIVPIPDAGTHIAVGKRQLQAVPAHYLHSSGNFHLYDADARILFSGDVGAAMLPAGEDAAFVTDFDRHIRHAKDFHQRWMGSKAAVLDWCERAAAMPIDLLCPQHGAVYQGADVMRFINWFAELEVGTGVRRGVN